MVFITADSYTNAQVHNITVKNKDYFWVKMKDVQNKLGIKNIAQHLRNELCGKFETNNLTKEQKLEYIKSDYQITKVEADNKRDKFVKYEIIEKIIKNCRGVKKSNDGINRMQKEDKRENVS